ncbi:MAG: hypothetical protein LWW79_11365 [Holophagaceae bacterium]|nr:hypothetical protein [Holophagaceae bacterium]
MELDLDAKEMELLTRTLEHRLGDLQREIHHTDRATFKAILKADEATIRALLGKLKAPIAMGM